MHTKIINNLNLSVDVLKEFYLKNEYNENMFNKDGSINQNYNSKKTLVLLQKYLKITGIIYLQI